MLALVALAFFLPASAPDSLRIQTVDFSRTDDSAPQQAKSRVDTLVESVKTLPPAQAVDTAQPATTHRPRPAIGLPSMAAARQYKSGQSRRTAGRILGWCGVGSFVTGLLAERPELVSAGLVAVEVGLPIHGSGASDMAKAAYAGDPNLPADANGWTAYKVGWGFFGTGTALVYIGLVKLFAGAFDENKRNETDGEKLVTVGSLSLLGGMVSHGIAWGQFSHSANDAHSAMVRQGLDISLAPQLHRDKHGLKPGIGLLARF